MVDIFSQELEELFSRGECRMSKMLLDYVHEAHNNIQKRARVFMDAVSRDEYDEDILKILKSSYSLIMYDWQRILNTEVDYARFNAFRLNSDEFQRYSSYAKAAFDTYYQCSNHIIDMRIRTGDVDPSKRVSFLEAIISQRYSHGLFMVD